MPSQLPLFPLGTVLFPGLVMPLHVFEPRYRVLVAALMALPEGALREFGVVAIRSGREVGEDGVRALHAVGCTARLREVTELDDGRFDIVVVGATRFRLDSLDTSAGTPYHTGVVELLDEEDGGEDDAAAQVLARSVSARFADYRRRLGLEPVEIDDDPQLLSYLVAAGAVLDVPVRQSLLEQPTTTDRLRAEVDLLRRESALISAFGALPAVDLVRTATSPN